MPTPQIVETLRRTTLARCCTVVEEWSRTAGTRGGDALILFLTSSVRANDAQSADTGTQLDTDMILVLDAPDEEMLVTKSDCMFLSLKNVSTLAGRW